MSFPCLWSILSLKSKTKLGLCFYVTVLLSVFLVACSSTETERVSIEKLQKSVDSYVGQRVEVTGVVKHICGVDQKKFKLYSDSGSFIKIEASEGYPIFDRQLQNQQVSVVGVVVESRIESDYLDQIEEEKLLLCHVDHLPCGDSAWVEGLQKRGVADSISLRSCKKLRDQISSSGKSYLSVVTIVAESCHVLPE